MIETFLLNNMSGNSKLKTKIELLYFGLILVYAYTISDKIAIDLGASGFTSTWDNFDSVEVFSILVFAPIVEELICRGFLTKNEKYYWFMLLPTVLLGVILNQQIAWMFCMLVFIVIIVYSLNLLVRYKRSLFLILFVITGIIFSLLHVPLINTGSISTDYAVALMAYLPSSFYLGYMRFKYGILFAILIHAFLNLFTLVINGIIY